MFSLKNKKILYIGQNFFGYEKEIKLMMESMGAHVDYYNERPNDNFLTKVLIRLRLKIIINVIINKYYSDLLLEIKNTRYDYVLILKIETIDEKILKKLKENQSDAEFILYMWDSIKNYRNNEKILPYFDKAFSFDRSDSCLYKGLKFLPLFYIPAYENNVDNKIKYDLCFVGSAHSDRYQIVKKISQISNNLNLNMYVFLFLQSKAYYLFRKVFDKRMWQARKDDFSFIPLSQEKILELISQSNVIIDIEHPGQTGLTMRTMEMLGSKKKLITTNKSISEYDFYNENNICIIDRDEIKIKKSFFDTPYVSIDAKIYEKYSLHNWIKSIF